MAETEIWLTPEAFDKLQEEYAYLTTKGRAEVTAKIASAREEGDLSENGGYHAAREEQGHMEARIAVLKDKLERAKVGETAGEGRVAAGHIVTIAFDGDPDDTETFLLGSREVLALDDSVDVPVYSPSSPLGAAVMGKKKGQKASYKAPNGKAINVVIIDITSS